MKGECHHCFGQYCRQYLSITGSTSSGMLGGGGLM